MREIKFRAWDPKHKHMFIVKEFGFSENNTWCTSKRDGYRHWNAPMMQFTGLKDKNGKEIYEGDIILFNNFGNTLDKVIYSSGCFRTLRRGYLLDKIREIEIIGNIYEHPELLERVINNKHAHNNNG